VSKDELAKRLRDARRSAGLTQAEVGRSLGVCYQAVSNYERGTNRVDSQTLARLCDLYGVSVNEVLGRVPPLPEGAMPYTRGARVPILGVIPAGTPLLAEENIEGWAELDAPNPKDYFFLRVRGDSMKDAGINDGDIVLIQRQSHAESGQIVVCRLNGEEATLKRFKRQGKSVLLLPENPDYEPCLLPAEAFENGEASILGVCREVRHRFE
jgi:repressor LexA